MFFQDDVLLKLFENPDYERRFGEYLGSYISDNKQVRADLCKERNALTAHIEFLDGHNYDDVTDKWYKELNITRQLGFDRIFRINYVNGY